MTGELLRLDNVHTDIGSYRILHGVDLTVPRSGLTMLLGRNGAGKTTTLRTIMGLWRASTGSIGFNGKNIAGLSTPHIARQGIAYVPETMGIFSDLSVAQNMVIAARSARGVEDIDAARLRKIFRFFPAIEKFWSYPAGKLSGGQKQMLAIARAMVEPRDLLLIDEPTKGLAPSILENLVEAFEDLKGSGTTILMVEQNVQLAERLGDTVAVMDNGRIVHEGSMKAFAGDDSLKRSLLGLSL